MLAVYDDTRLFGIVSSSKGRRVFLCNMLFQRLGELSHVRVPPVIPVENEV